jgi:hypothetical protein
MQEEIPGGTRLSRDGGGCGHERGRHGRHGLGTQPGQLAAGPGASPCRPRAPPPAWEPAGRSRCPRADHRGRRQRACGRSDCRWLPMSTSRTRPAPLCGLATRRTAGPPGWRRCVASGSLPRCRVGARDPIRHKSRPRRSGGRPRRGAGGVRRVVARDRHAARGVGTGQPARVDPHRGATPIPPAAWATLPPPHPTPEVG